MVGLVKFFGNTNEGFIVGNLEFKCCNKVFKSKQFKLIEVADDVKTESFVYSKCPNCGSVKINMIRAFNDKKPTFKARWIRNSAKEYYNYHKSNNNLIEILEDKIQTGSASNINWTYGKNNTIYNFNDKSVGSRVTNPINTIKGDFTPERVLTA